MVADELQSLRSEFDAVICEGAGSPAEINLRATDLANMGLARAADLPVILVGDIDRGGLLAHLFGTVAVLEPEDQRSSRDSWSTSSAATPPCWRRGWRSWRQLTGRPTYGVIPYTDGLWLDTEDSVSVLAHRVVGRSAAAARANSGCGWRAIRLPRISNSTDVEALACEPGVLVRWVTDPADLADSRRRGDPRQQGDRGRPGAGCATADWPTASPRTRRKAGRCWASAADSRCCAAASTTRWSPVPAASTGLGLLDADIVFAPDKTLRHHEAALHGYEIHHGQLARCAEDDWLGVGIRRGTVYGTHWHGLLDNNELRRRWLTEIGPAAGSSSPTTSTSRRGATPNST